MNCPNCSAANPDGTKYCRKCGHRFNNVASNETIVKNSGECPHCGHVNPVDSRFCNQCATPLQPGAIKFKERRGHRHDQNVVNRNWLFAVSALVVFVLVLAIVFGPNWRQTSNPPNTAPSSPSSAAVEISEDPADNPELQQRLKSLDEQLAGDPHNSELLTQKAHLYYDFGYFEPARELYLHILQHTPEDADILVDCGTAFFYTDMPESALQYYHKAVQVQPDHVNATYNMAIVLNSLGQHEEAVSWFEKALTMEPNGPLAERARDFINQFNVMKMQQSK